MLRARRDIPTDPTKLPDTPEPGAGPAEIVAASDVARTVQAALVAIDPNERLAVVLRDVEQLPMGDVAERLTDLMEGDLDHEEESAALEHLATCDRCEQVLAETRDVVSLAREHGRVELRSADGSRMFGTLVDELESRSDH